MKARLAVLAACGLASACATPTKFIDPRGDLDRKIYYLERDRNNERYPISSPQYSEDSQKVERIPLPAAVDINSTIQIRIAREKSEEADAGALGRGSERFANAKLILSEALSALADVVEAGAAFAKAYDGKATDPETFFRARQKRDDLEGALIDKLDPLWDKSSPTYAAFDKAYDPPKFEKLQVFLSNQLKALEGPNRRIERELANRKRRLVLNAFLNSPGKDPTAIHLDGYDSIKAETLETRDIWGLDLSPTERARLDAQVKATEDLARSLERLRRGEATLNQTLDQLKGELNPELASLLKEAQDLQSRASAAAKRPAETDKLASAFLEALGKANAQVAATQKVELQKVRDELVADAKTATEPLNKTLSQWLNRAKRLQSTWASTGRGPSEVLALLNEARKLGTEFDDLRKEVPGILKAANGRADKFFEDTTSQLLASQRAVIKGPQASALRANLQEYANDIRKTQSFIVHASAVLSVLGQPAIPEIPGTTAGSLEIPLDEVKDTFIDLEQTPRLVGDTVTVRATLKDDQKVVETSTARFRIERFGHYAELSPAVVLAKPQHIAGTDTGFRFAPTLSWLYHWGARPEDTGYRAALYGALDPSIGIHSAFLNFNSPTSSSSAQIGLGATLGFWKNRLQFGYGVNLMAKSAAEGRVYYFIGSDLIGLLQAIGIAKPQ